MNSTNKSKSSIKKKFLAVLLPLVIVFGGLEIGARVINSFLTSEKAAARNFIFIPGKITPSESGALPTKPNISVDWAASEWSVSVNTNSFGLRESVDTELKDVQVAFFGDSFSFGQGIEDDEQYSDFFAENSNFARNQVVNFSYINGFEPEHYEFYLKSNPALAPEVAVVGLYLGNDLYSDPNETFYDPKSNQLEFLGRSVSATGQLLNVPSSLRWPWSFGNSWSEFSKLTATLISVSKYRENLYKPGMSIPNSPNSVELERGETDLKTNRAITSLTRINTLISERGGKLVVVVIPQSYYFGTFPNPHLNDELKPIQADLIAGQNLRKQTLETCKVVGLTCLDTSPWLTADDFFLQDGHWNAKGQEAVGKNLAKEIANLAVPQN
jgi:hypothetical protein